MGYTVRTKDNPLDLGRADDQNDSVDNDIFFYSQHLSAVVPWDVDKPPDSPGSIDDEFADGSLAGAWTEYDPDNKTAWSEGNGGAKATILTTATLTLNGIYQDLPAGDFSVVIKAGILTLEAASGTFIGINLWENPAGDNKQFQYAFFRDNTAGFVARIVAQDWTNCSTIGTVNIAGVSVGFSDAIYLRLRRNGTNYYCDFSFAGLGWRSANGGAAVTLAGGWTPTKIGIGVLNYNTGATQAAIAQFFRYVGSDVGLSGVLAGARG